LEEEDALGDNQVKVDNRLRDIAEGYFGIETSKDVPEKKRKDIIRKSLSVMAFGTDFLECDEGQRGGEDF
jgi:hypothetical protein